LLDIEKNPAEQEYKSHSFDIVIAAQVLHATKNLGQTLEHVRSLLAPEGIFILVEAAVSNSLYFDVYLPILQPFEESDKLRSHHPFLTMEQWYDALRKYGFVEAESFPQTDALEDHIFIAKASVTASAFTETVSTISTIPASSKESAHLPKSAHSRLQLKSAYIAPRNELERTMTNTWEKFLGIEHVGIFDDFFELGGDSLMAVQLVSELRRTNKVELSAHNLLEKSTVAALAESIQSIPTNDDTQVSLQALPQSLVKIKAGNPLKQPIFLVHPIGGHIHIYHDLAHCLDIEQAVYAIPAQGVDGKTRPLTQIEEMATHYINVLRVVQPEGPYFLGGHSFGGLVAFEMAQQLHALGQRITLLFMMDTIEPKEWQLLIGNTDSDEAKDMAYALGLNININLPEHFNQLELEEQIRYYFDKSKIAKQVHSEEFFANIRHLLYVIKANHQAIKNYVPKTYPGRILFFRALERDANLPTNPEHSWVNLATEGVDIHEVPGNHTSMNFSPNVEVMANFLKRYLN